MIFTSLTFVIFLIVIFAAYWALPRQPARNAFLVITSYFFYGWWDWRFSSLMLISSVLDFAIGLALVRTSNPTARRALLILSLLGNLGMLGFFKYFNFFSENFAILAGRFGWEPGWTTLNIVLPVGISFYTFQTLSYTIDIYRGHLQPTRRFIDYMAYVCFFPQLVAGPIERAAHLLPQFLQQRYFNEIVARDGLRQMLWGAFKKVVIADNLAIIVDQVYANPGAHGGPMLALATVCFAFQIYCDFSGYSDIAIGCSKLFDIRLMRNFAYPYFSQSVAEFWRRWHISLSTWFRDYVYIPLGGGRVSRPRRVLNVLITFILSGFWHGAAWNFIIWGAINGVAALPGLFHPRRTSALAADVTPGGEKLLPSPIVFARILLTFSIICLAWVFFRAATFNDSILILQRIGTELFSGEGWASVKTFLSTDKTHKRALIYIGVLVVTEWLMRRQPHPLEIAGVAKPWRWIIYSILIWIILYDGTGGAKPFIYFQF